TRQAAAFLGTQHHELILTRQELWDNLEATVWSTELPFASLAPVGKFLLSKLARQHVTVVLNGQGADEVFLGYRDFFQRAIDGSRRCRSTSPASVGTAWKWPTRSKCESRVWIIISTMRPNASR